MTTTPMPAVSHTVAPSRSADVAAFIAGALAAALGIAISTLIAGLVVGAPSLLIAVGDLVIDLQPPGAKEVVADLFGDTKLFLNSTVFVTALIIAGSLGVGGRRSWNIPVAGFIAAGLVGLVASLSQPLYEPLFSALTLIVSIGAALAVLRLMLSATQPAWAPRTDASAAAASSTIVAADAAATDLESGSDSTAEPMPEEKKGAIPPWDRRRFLQTSGAVAVGSILLGVLGRNLLTGQGSGPDPDVPLPTAAGPAPEVPETASLDVEGITPIVVPNDSFYQIDTALISPRVNVDDWTLRIHGLVDREVTLTYDDLSTMPLFEQFVTIACVSNKVGGRLVGNALWTGVDLRDVLDMAGVQPGADQIASRSVDGWNCGFPTEWALDPERKPMIALGMNGSPLPVDHGYPARLIIPGLYGYVSATKWLSEIELTTWDAFDGYWIPRGWAKEAPILTQSRIDTPTRGARLEMGTAHPIAGVAWAPDRGVQGVEVSIDDGSWQQAEISDPLNDATWVQWVLPWTPDAAGSHSIKVRAIDGTGEVQTAEETRPDPDGARGHHEVVVSTA